MPDYEEQYKELVDALCSPSWIGRERHASVVALAKRLRNSQQFIRALVLDEVHMVATVCVRAVGHDGPCNGLPRADCGTAPLKAAPHVT